MGYGGMPRKKKDDIDWDNLETEVAEVEKQPEQSGQGQSKTQAKKDKRAKKKGGKGDDDDDDKPFNNVADEDEEDDAIAKPAKKGKDKKGGKGKPASFADLPNEDDEDASEPEEPVSKPASKKQGKGKVDFAALLPDEDEQDEDADEEDEEEEAPKANGKSKKPNAKKVDDEDEDEDTPKKGKGKSQGKSKVVASFAALSMEDEEEDEKDEDEEMEVEEEESSKASKKKSKKKESKKEETKEERKGGGSELELPSLTLEEQKLLKDAVKKSGRPFEGVVVGLIQSCNKHPKADNLMILQVSDGGFGNAQVITNAKNVAEGLKVAFAPVGAEIFDEELGAGTTTVKSVKLKGINSAGMLCSGKLLGLNEEEGQALVFPDNTPLGLGVAEAYYRVLHPEMLQALKDHAEAERKAIEERAAAKKAEQEAKKAAAAAASAAGGGEEEGEGEEKAGESSKNKKKKGKGDGDSKPKNAKLAALQEMQRLLREEEERIRKMEEERKKEEEEALRLQQEMEAAEEERKRLKKERKKEKEEQLRREGKLLSKKQKEQQAKNEAFRKTLEEQGMVPPRINNESDDEEEKGNEAGNNQTKKLSKNEILQLEKERKQKQRALQEERERKKREEEEARLKAEQLAKELANVQDNWEDDEDADQGKDEEDSSEDSGSGSEYDSDGNKLSKTQRRTRKAKKAAQARRMKQMETNLQKKSKDNLRCPVVCVLGHVDTGKTKILDKIRRTNVQDGEAGGITQQIGASFFPIDAITEKTRPVMELHKVEYNVPGLLIIDTPGHESFTNLRTRGSSLCDLAVLVVDIMHGLEPQTIESIGLLKKRRAPFVIALNKIDRLYGWEPHPELPVQQALEMQADSVKAEFQQRYDFAVRQLQEQGLNACVFYENQDVRTFLNVVPTSAISGDGMMDLLFLLSTLPAKMLIDKIMYHENLECTVLEVKAIEGLGTTMDVIVVNGKLKEKQKIVVCGLEGPIVTQIRSLLTPQPMKEMRVKTPYIHHQEIKGAIGVKICANGIERALAGSNLYVVGEDDDEEELKDEVMKDLGGILKKVKKNEDGVYVQASTLGSLEALLEFLERPGEDRDGNPNPPIPVSGIGIGPVSKYDVMRCGVMLEREREWVKMCEKEYAQVGEWVSGNPLNSFKEAYACILAFDVPVLPDAERSAKEIGIPIYTAEIIYHLFDAFTKRVADIKAKKKEEAKKKALYPVVFKIVDERCVFNKKDPYILGIDVVEGTLKLGLPVVIPNVKWTGDAKTQTAATELLEFGQVMSIEKDKKAIDSATRASGNVAIRIEQRKNMKEYTFGRHWTHESLFVSRLNRESIDLLKEHFRDEVPKEDWKLVVKLKKLLNIP
uniref:Eukaryotic translation initiation factor 5B n=1 Tax=Guillardia theta TaxID=55529 RepID=A0A7S4P4S0_GUITH|mmetsp:Transcript_43127/g.136273  ORF Transcript_43127/g.136273 Transcript_43127/m.136273 type:complete len:1351 (+) Transcript_43127:317-4369(+)